MIGFVFVAKLYTYSTHLNLNKSTITEVTICPHVKKKRTILCIYSTYQSCTGGVGDFLSWQSLP